MSPIIVQVIANILRKNIFCNLFVYRKLVVKNNCCTTDYPWHPKLIKIGIYLEAEYFVVCPSTLTAQACAAEKNSFVLYSGSKQMSVSSNVKQKLFHIFYYSLFSFLLCSILFFCRYNMSIHIIITKLRAYYLYDFFQFLTFQFYFHDDTESTGLSISTIFILSKVSRIFVTCIFF